MQLRLKLLIGLGGSECGRLRSCMNTQSLFLVRMYTSIFQKLATNEFQDASKHLLIKIHECNQGFSFKTHDCRLIIRKVTRTFLTKRCKNIYSSLVFQCLVVLLYHKVLYTRIF